MWVHPAGGRPGQGLTGAASTPPPGVVPGLTCSARCALSPPSLLTNTPLTVTAAAGGQRTAARDATRMSYRKPHNNTQENCRENKQTPEIYTAPYAIINFELSKIENVTTGKL